MRPDTWREAARTWIVLALWLATPIVGLLRIGKDLR